MTVEAAASASRPKSERAAKRSREELEFLPAMLEVLETPPRPAARMIVLTICAFFACALAWSIIGHIDTVAVAQGQLVTTERVKLVQPLEPSIVRAIHVRDGQHVARGDILVELDPTEAQANVDSLRYDLVKARLEAAAAAAILTEDPANEFTAPDGAAPHHSLGLLQDVSSSHLEVPGRSVCGVRGRSRTSDVKSTS